VAASPPDPGRDFVAPTSCERTAKRKLRIKDMIATLESKLIPDLDA
jgi:hypothetical protein